MALTGIKTDPVSPTVAEPVQAIEVQYPSDDGERMVETDLQYYAIVDSVFALKRHLKHLGRNGTVRADCALYYDSDRPSIYVAPDVLFAFDVIVPRSEGFVPRVQGKVPDLVMEMASRSTHAQDSGSKHARYAKLGIGEYWQYDPHHQYLPDELIGWQLKVGRYEKIPVQLDQTRGAWVGESRILGTAWGLDQTTQELRLWNPSAQAWYLTDREEVARADREKARADREAVERRREAARADQAETEVARLQALLRVQGKDPSDSPN